MTDGAPPGTRQEPRPRSGDDKTPPLIRVEMLSIAFGGLHAVEDVTLQLLPGEILGLIGPNGAGKTTLLNLISGHETPTAGRIFIDEHDVTGWPLHRRARLGMARSYQSANIFPALTARQNVMLAGQAAGPGHYRLLRPPAGLEDLAQRAEHALEITGLSRRADAVAQTLGHGETRALEVAMLLATNARAMLMDEPAAGMAAEDTTQMIATIDAAHRESGAAIILVEHKLNLIFELCEHIAVLDRGRLIAFGSPDAVAKDERVRSAYLGEEVSHV
jgi:branched-chain amino acid transport system ATP-binding protein